MSAIFRDNAPEYWAKDHSVIPLDGKAAVVKGWTHYLNGPPKVETRQDWLDRYASYNIGHLMGGPIDNDYVLNAVDGDDDALVAVIDVIVGHTPCSKTGKKGRTDFVKVLKSAKIKSSQICDCNRVGKIDILCAGKQTVLPPSIHPETKEPYRWNGKPLLEINLTELPELTQRKIDLLKLVIGSKYLHALISGETTHDAGLAFVAQLIAADCSNSEVTAIFRATLPSTYEGNSLDELENWIVSAREKFGSPARPGPYDPGSDGPIPLGRDGDLFHFRCQQTNRLSSRSARELSVIADLLSLAAAEFWLERFPKAVGKAIVIDTIAACDALIQGCTKKGHLEASDIRGFGLWEEDGRLVRNTGGAVIESDRYVYSYPSVKPASVSSDLDMRIVLEFFQQANWEVASSPLLLLGWCFTAVICGALPWRPHLAITGAAMSGKSTQLRGVSHLLSTVAVILEGISTEAGIRQNIAYDARPCILDELEAEGSGDTSRIARILKLIRSASSATGSVARGTQNGTPFNFCTRASFLVGAINMRRISSADSSRMPRLEMRPPDGTKGSRTRVLELLDSIKGYGPAFCDLSMSLARETLDSIPILHAVMPAIDERQADNLATMFAGYWVAMNRRTINAAEAEALVSEHFASIRQQQEDTQENDAIEALNLLLAYPLGDQAKTPIGAALTNTLADRSGAYHVHDTELARFGVRIEGDGFLVATSHPTLRDIYRNSRWEGGVWGDALSRLPGAHKTKQRRFDGVRSIAVWIPATEVPPSDDHPAVAKGGTY